ncbi:MAG: butyryl-CoA dehydrogenase, partial [Elusimicrobia bacterium]
MDYGLTEQQQEIVALARRIADEKVRPMREHYDKTEEFPWAIVEEVRKSDLYGVYLPEKYGGLGGGNFELVLAAEQLSRACAGITMCLGASALCVTPILLFGTEAQRRRFIPDIASGKRLGAFA